MTESLGYSLTDLKPIFQGNFFRIPDYQRGYAWGNSQVTDLLKDLEHMRDSGDGSSQHYTGTLVVTKPDVDGRFQIVDGRQRLTTFVIFMHCLASRCELSDQAERPMRAVMRQWTAVNSICGV